MFAPGRQRRAKGKTGGGKTLGNAGKSRQVHIRTII